MVKLAKIFVHLVTVTEYVKFFVTSQASSCSVFSPKGGRILMVVETSMVVLAILPFVRESETVKAIDLNERRWEGDGWFLEIKAATRSLNVAGD